MKKWFNNLDPAERGVLIIYVVGGILGAIGLLIMGHYERMR